MTAKAPLEDLRGASGGESRRTLVPGMPRRRERTPPLPWIRAFESAARQGSFLGAGRELSVSAAAVSRSIKELERSIGVELFKRYACGVELTSAGRTYARALTPALRQIEEASAEVRAEARRSVLRPQERPMLGNLLVTIVVFVLLSLTRIGAASEAGRPPRFVGAYDLWIRNGIVVDGTGQPRRAADVLIFGDSIAFIGAVPSGSVMARRIIDAHGDIVAPGFIDAHAHGDPLSQSFLNFLEQGVTTVLLGQDGFTPSYDPDRTPAESLSLWMKRLDEAGSEVNVAALSGHGALRMLANVGDTPTPSAAQLKLMQALLEDDLAAGAFGLSFGLEYEPGRYAGLAEEKTLGDLVGRHGGIVMSHMRSEDNDKIAGAIDELLAIDAHVHVSHMKIVAGRRAEEADAVLSQLARARSSGREVTGDVYPYLASASNFVFLYPDWAKREADYASAVDKRRPELEAHIRKRVSERNGPGAILITEGRYAGLNLEQVAARLKKPYEQVMIDDLGYGGPAQAHFLMAAGIQDKFITADQVCISTDGAPNSSHPRSYGSFSKVLEDYVGPPPKMSLEQAVHKMSGLAAQIIGIPDRGVLATGKKADVVMFVADGVHNRATWTRPRLAPVGIDMIIVNGAVAYEGGKPDARKHGRALRKATS